MARLRTSLPDNCIQVRVQDAITMMTNLEKRLDGEKEDQNLTQKSNVFLVKIKTKKHLLFDGSRIQFSLQDQFFVIR